MTAETLIALRKARNLSQQDAALHWGVAINTVWRWEHDQRPIPLWVERMFEREHPLQRKIEVLEKKIALLAQIPRAGSRPQRPPWAW